MGEETQRTIDKIIRKFRRDREEDWPTKEHPGRIPKIPKKGSIMPILICPRCKKILKYRTPDGSYHEVVLLRPGFGSKERCPGCGEIIDKWTRIAQGDDISLAEGRVIR